MSERPAGAMISPASMRLLRTLAGRPPQTMSALIDATGVTRTAVTEQLGGLMEAGFVQRRAQRTGRGRPRYLYTLSTDAEEVLCASNERRFAALLFDALLAETDADTTRRVLHRAMQSLADHYDRQITGQCPAERLRELAALLECDGVVVDLSGEGDDTLLCERTCPFVKLIDQDRTVCQLEVEMISQVVQAPVELCTCRLDTSAACTFRLAPT